MGNRARFTVASVVSLAAASVPFIPLAACSDGSIAPPTFPTEGSVPDPRTTTKDAKPPEDVIAEPAVDAGSCDPLGPQIDVLNVPEDPNNFPFGGVVPDGTYVLTSAVYGSAARDGGVAFKRAGRMKFSGKDVVWQFDTDKEGKPEPTCCVGTWAYNASEVMNMSVTCNGENKILGEFYDLYPMGIANADSDIDAAAVVDAGAGSAPQLMIHVGALHDIYTKQ